jgi:uncharacterized protein (DUF1778 family)
VKTEQLQIRVTSDQKVTLKHLAQKAGQDVSSYVLSRVLPRARVRFAELLVELSEPVKHRYVLASLNDLLTSLAPLEFQDAVVDVDFRNISRFLQNYVAAMVEQAAAQKRISPPDWVRQIPPLEEPYFAAPLRSLRLHLLRSSPVPFRRRNLFVDSGIGARV